MNAKNLAICALLLGAGRGAAQTAPDSVPLYFIEPLVVTGVRERAVPPPVASIRLSPERLARTRASNPYDLLRRVSGIEVHEQGQGAGFASDVVVRGFTSDHAADVLLVVDGVPVNLPVSGHGEGYADWTVLMQPVISDLRLIYGTASPLYGDFALGGTVEAFTASDAEGSRVALTSSTFGDLGGWAVTGLRRERGGALAAIELRSDRGWRDNSTSRVGNTLLRGWRLLGGGRLEGGALLSLARWRSPGFVRVADFEAGSSTLAADETDGGRQLRGVLHARFARPLRENVSLHVGAWGQGADWRLFLNQPEANGPVEQVGERDRRLASGGQAELTFQGGEDQITVGLSARSDLARFTLARTLARVASVTDVELLARHRSASAFARWRRLVTERLGVDLGARVDVVEHASRDRMQDDVAWESDVQSVLSPKLGVRYSLRTGTELRASASRGFRSAVGVIGDPDRPPILAWSNELGIEHTEGAFTGQVSFFRLDVSNERRLNPVTREISSEGSSVRQGVDGRASFDWRGATLEIGGVWNHARLHGPYADAHDDHHHGATTVAGPITAHDTTVAEGATRARVPGVSDYTAHLALSRALEFGIEGTAALRVTGPFVPIGEPDVRTDPYAVLDLSASVPLRGVWLDLDLQNLLGTRYPELRASGFVNPGNPRVLRVAVRFQ